MNDCAGLVSVVESQGGVIQDFYAIGWYGMGYTLYYVTGWFQGNFFSTTCHG